MRKFVKVLLLLPVLAACSVTGSEGDGDGGGPLWDAGNIISDQVFYNSDALPGPASVQNALDLVGAGCAAPTCLKTASYSTPSMPSGWCTPYVGSPSEKYADMLYKMAKACGINPEVAIVMIQKESQGLTRPIPPAALTGFGCPDTGPGGSANCNSASAGVFQQTWGMFQSFAKLHKDASYVNYPEGQTNDILWNVAETGCGSAPVLVKNRATATLYTYTPYQPNPASLAAYPGTGDRCSSYGNRNFFEMFKKYFGSTGGGSGGAGAGSAVLASGTRITLPSNQYVAEAVRGKQIQAPNDAVARGVAAGLSQLGLPYVWGGGGGGAGPNDGCSRGGGQLNSCQGLTGFDCSGLTAYVLVQAGYPSPGGESTSQRHGGAAVPYGSGAAGDIVGFPGHVAIYLGTIDGTPYILEASDVGVPVHVVPLTRSDRDPVLHRYWTTGGLP